MNRDKMFLYLMPISRDFMIELRVSPCSQATKNESVKQNQNIIEKQNGSERIISLHGRLQQEAEKIRKWKLQMEMDLKTKVFVSIWLV